MLSSHPKWRTVPKPTMVLTLHCCQAMPTLQAVHTMKTIRTMQKQAVYDDFHASRQREIEEWRRLPLSRRIPSNSPRLLPEIDEKDRGKKCLVLDLDGTLIYQHRSKDRADVDIYFEILDPSLVRKMKCSATIGRY
jgi:hypothetical protein